MSPIFKLGDVVETMFDTGARGAQILYGRVVRAGPKKVTIEWESGLRNRIDNGRFGVKIARHPENARFSSAGGK